MWLIDTGILTKKVICLSVMYYSAPDYTQSERIYTILDTQLVHLYVVADKKKHYLNSALVKMSTFLPFVEINRTKKASNTTIPLTSANFLLITYKKNNWFSGQHVWLLTKNLHVRYSALPPWIVMD